MNQALALEIMLAGHSVFLTGTAGSGKTHTLNTFIHYAKKQKKHLAITATTGLAATHLNGNTIHSWSGLGVHDDIPYRFFDRLPESRIKKIQTADILIIDEISMLHDFRLDLISLICQQARETFTKPFGGLQVIFSGDFFQLPPVNREGNKQGSFAYQAKSWQALNPVICYLEEQHRQNDPAYLEILGAIRNNDLRRRHAEQLLSRTNVQLNPKSPLTELHTTNFDVDRLNSARLKTLKTAERTFEMTTTGSKTYVDNLKRSCLTPDTLHLKPGAIVMTTKNHPGQKYSNGSIGKLVDFDSTTSLPIVEFKNGTTMPISPDTWELRDGEQKRASLTQIPLRLAWAITIHKSQGMTLDAARIDLRRAFEPGMGYVALSRIKSLDSLHLIGINKTALQVSPEVLLIDQVFRNQTKTIENTFAHLLENPVAPTLESQKSTKNSPENPDQLTPYQIRIAKLRKTLPNANRPWSIDDSHDLIDRFLDGQNIPDLATHFGRKPRALMLRLNTCLDTEIFTEDEIRTANYK